MPVKPRDPSRLWAALEREAHESVLKAVQTGAKVDSKRVLNRVLVR